MITKQQALEFIYELLKEYTLKIDVTNSHGFLEISSSRYRTEIFEAFADLLEEFMTEFIKQYLNTGIFENMDKIPVDVDMLEVGQTYKVELDDFYDGCHSVHIAKYTGEEEGYYYFKNRHTWRYEKKDLYQLWKVNNKESEM